MHVLMKMASSNEVEFERRGALGLVTLNRPKALNALTLGMIKAMRAQLRAWEDDARVTRVVVQGSGGRAFCAGGDVRRIYEAARAGEHELMFEIWRSEYDLVAAMARYAKPIIALIDGIAMGGGVGISVHGRYRVASETYAFAMPEVGIGFIPDVGTTYLLPRLPGHSGTYLALTGNRIGPGDALALGLATHAANAADFPAILDGLAEEGPIDTVLSAHAAPWPSAGPVVLEAALLDACFSADSVQAVLANLDAVAGSDFASATARTIRSRSPTSLCLAHEQMRRGLSLTLLEAISTEYRLVTRIMRGHDFYEGVRAVLIDKDNRPAWQPAALDDVDRTAILSAFEPTGDPEPNFG
ncbi:enoyl-CoA hydratase [Methylobacterium brachiatum]|uniref:3-hydroxyisobutyryl-CoA hydrolase n=1 Tax=Methylobacterium brachiatum TaxID=269660 RepID=A0AAJ1TXS4_9HYPH|nr:enoyl-CoA hydratase/isomerase family protein [Methylobacterium brachiatum]MCB4806442.1 enoyl-CoA hydratase/isomerase family protein [Methylobacterium brachiatum]MDQ0546664.1 enoyl-CoA hydratase [Methylobacterium brachiatum]